MELTRHHIVLCNGASLPLELAATDGARVLGLEYRPEESNRNVRLSLPDFVRDVYHLEARVLDLLEIAGYVFAADRLISRGRKDAVEYHSWARSIDFVIRIRDYEFWQKSEIGHKLSCALCFMSGDMECRFSFQPGHSTPLTSLFDKEQFELEQDPNTSIILFSGGIDSLAGAVERLGRSQDRVCLVSHRSGEPGTRKTQRGLYRALKLRYPGRVQHYEFLCSLKGVRAIEESQRTRSFLYSSIGYALSHAIGQNTFYLFENGVTAMNFPRRQDLSCARASRTSHPKTIDLLEDVFSELEGCRVTIETPFVLRTKTDVFSSLATTEHKDLIPSTVSCSRTFQNTAQATHCGGCFQCVDRRLAAYGSGTHEADESGIYSRDIVFGEIDDAETLTTIVDYVRQACGFAEIGLDQFHSQYFNELLDITEFMAGMDEETAAEAVWELCRRHGQQVERALLTIRQLHDRPFQAIPRSSLLEAIAKKEYLRNPADRLVDSICSRLGSAIPLAFQHNPPKDEQDFNDKVAAIIDSEREQFDREHPLVSFALTHPEADYASLRCDLLIECKYIRGATSPSKASEGIAADLIKYPERSHKLFVVYDRERSIVSDETFKTDFERKGQCTIFIIR